MLVFGSRGQPPLHPGVVRDYTVTVVPEDQHRLRCFEEQRTQNFSCEERSSARLAPYVTTERDLVLLAGLFSHEEVRDEVRLRRRKTGEARRFRVRCNAKLLRYTRSHRVQFGPQARIQPVSAWIAETLSCAPVP